MLEIRHNDLAVRFMDFEDEFSEYKDIIMGNYTYVSEPEPVEEEHLFPIQTYPYNPLSVLTIISYAIYLWIR